MRSFKNLKKWNQYLEIVTSMICNNHNHKIKESMKVFPFLDKV